jgi:hypothetical protein
MESFSCRSSSFLFASVLAFFASSALRTESVSLRSLVCSLWSISCRFFACKFDHRQQGQAIKMKGGTPLRWRFAPSPRWLLSSGCQVRYQTCFCRVFALAGTRSDRAVDVSYSRLAASLPGAPARAFEYLQGDAGHRGQSCINVSSACFRVWPDRRHTRRRTLNPTV